MLLQTYADVPRRFGFPDAQEAAARNLAASGRQLALTPIDDALREHLAERCAGSRACARAPASRPHARDALVHAEPVEEWWEPDLGEPELAEPPVPGIVARIMRDLRSS